MHRALHRAPWGSTSLSAGLSAESSGGRRGGGRQAGRGPPDRRQAARDHPQRASYVDHTLLKPETSREQIAALCAEARQYGFASVCTNPVCTNPVWTGFVREQLAGGDVLTCAAVEAGASRIGAGSGPALLS